MRAHITTVAVLCTQLAIASAAAQSMPQVELSGVLRSVVEAPAPPPQPPSPQAPTNAATPPPNINGLLLSLFYTMPSAIVGFSNPDPSVITTAELQKSLLPLRLSVQVREGATLGQTAAVMVTPDPPSGKRLVTAVPSAAAVRALITDQAVRAIEVERPSIVGPAMLLRPFNANARISHFVPELVAGTFGVLDGTGVRAAVIDGGRVLASHVELATSDADVTSRVRVDTASDVSDHATHVAGTMAARGVKKDATGMAPRLALISDDFGDDLTKLRSLASHIQISNHSYGPFAGWYEHVDEVWYWWGDKEMSAAEDPVFGKYSAESSELDSILHDHPGLLTFVAAGNDRDDLPSTQPLTHYDIANEGGQLVWKSATDTHRPDGWDRGLDTISGIAVAKNAITIGSIDDVRQGTPIVTEVYSGFGPADDGRIKPDLVANGHQLLSLGITDDKSYEWMTGTSMASPTAAGIAALLMQEFQARRGRTPISAEIKAVLIHTATNAGVPGPDPMYGWGSINALKAGQVIFFPDQHAVERATLTTAQPYERTFEGSAAAPVRVTIVWTDPPGPANAGGLDDATPTLTHDLDLAVIAPDGTKFFPYALNRANPLAPATATGPNHVDNVEMADAPPAAGQWKVVVTAATMNPSSSQTFALVTSGLK